MRGIKLNTRSNGGLVQLSRRISQYTRMLISNRIGPERVERDRYACHQSLWEYVVFLTGQPSFQTNEDPGDDEDVIATNN